MKRKIGKNPLDAVIPPLSNPPTRTTTKKQNKKKNTKKQNKKNKNPRTVDRHEDVADHDRAKVRATFHIPRHLVEEARDTVYWLSGPPLRLTLAELVEKALAAELKRLKRAHNDGEPFAQRNEDLRGGRPIKQ